MILRVYALWNQSNRVLYTLLFIYVPQVIISFVGQGIYRNPNTYLSSMSQAKLMLNCNLICGPFHTTNFSSQSCPSY
jgi:hypothetical protein